MKGKLIACSIVALTLLAACGVPVEEHAATVSELATAQAANTTCRADLETSREDLATSEGQLTSCTSNLAERQRRVVELTADVQETQADLREVEGHTCALSWPIDYTSNATVSESLQAYAEENGGSILRAEWEVIWSGWSSAAIHRVYVEPRTMWVFVVTFADENFRQDSTYSVDMQCFLEASQ